MFKNLLLLFCWPGITLFYLAHDFLNVHTFKQINFILVQSSFPV